MKKLPYIFDLIAKDRIPYMKYGRFLAMIKVASWVLVVTTQPSLVE